MTDSGEGKPRLHDAVIGANLAKRLFHDGELIGRIVDDEVA